MGINDTYAQARSQILLMCSLLIINQVYSMTMIMRTKYSLLICWNCRVIEDGSWNLKNNAMYTKTMNQKGKRNYNPNYNPNGICDHCKLQGH